MKELQYFDGAGKDEYVDRQQFYSFRLNDSNKTIYHHNNDNAADIGPYEVVMDKQAIKTSTHINSKNAMK